MIFKMTMSYNIWHQNIWVKYIVKAFWQWTIIRWKNIEVIKIQYSNDRSNNTIGSIMMSKDYYWSSIKNWSLSKCLCRTCRRPTKLKKSVGPRQDQRTRQRALHPSSFHCCHRRDLSYLFVVFVPIVCALFCVLCLEVLVYQRNSVRERAFEQGATRHPVPKKRRSLSKFHSQLLSAWFVGAVHQQCLKKQRMCKQWRKKQLCFMVQAIKSRGLSLKNRLRDISD